MATRDPWQLKIVKKFKNDKGDISDLFRFGGELNALFEVLQDDFNKTNQKALKAAAYKVRKHAQDFAPVDTGATKKSIRVFYRSRNLNYNNRYFVVRAGGHVYGERFANRFIRKSKRLERIRRDISYSREKQKRSVFVWWAAAVNSKNGYMNKAIYKASQGDALAAFKNVWASYMETRYPHYSGRLRAERRREREARKLSRLARKAEARQNKMLGIMQLSFEF